MWRMLVLARLAIHLSLGQVAKESKGEDPVWNIRHLLPEVEIDPRLIHNVTVQVGTSAQLPCSFRKDYLEEVKRQHIEKQRQLRQQQQQQLQQQQQRYHDGLVDLHDLAFEAPEIHEEETFDAEHQVSWFRRRDWHILTTGIFTYTTDDRFEVIHPPDSGDWTLQVRYATARDSGMYECQLSTGSGVESQFTRLQVVEPRSVLQNAAALHFQLGSTIQLDCVIVESPKPPPYVYWYHNHRVINFDTMRGGVNISTTQTDGETHSSLIVYDARESDTGNYTCSAPNTKASSTSVFVTDGDKMAAIQRRKATGGGDKTVSPRLLSSISSSVLLLLLLLFFAR